MMVEVGKAKEGLNVLDFSWYWPILNDLKGSDMELTFVCMGKKSVSVESGEYFPNMEFVLRNIVRIDEDVVQIYDDYDVDHI